LQESSKNNAFMASALMRYCPNCGQPMLPVPGCANALTCSECGVFVGLDKNEERFFKDA
jgi:hypothetical protein